MMRMGNWTLKLTMVCLLIVWPVLSRDGPVR